MTAGSYLFSNSLFLFTSHLPETFSAFEGKERKGESGLGKKSWRCSLLCLTLLPVDCNVVIIMIVVLSLLPCFDFSIALLKQCGELRREHEKRWNKWNNETKWINRSFVPKQKGKYRERNRMEDGTAFKMLHTKIALSRVENKSEGDLEKKEKKCCLWHGFNPKDLFVFNQMSGGGGGSGNTGFEQ